MQSWRINIIAGIDKREWSFTHREYKEKWGYSPNRQDFLCTDTEYFLALKKSVESGTRIETILKPNPAKIKNQRLINSLNNRTSSSQVISRAKAGSVNRQDRVATSNISKIKHGGQSNEQGVASVVNEIRTVQSNKNLTKTRRAVIVRDNREHAPRTILAKTANFLSFVAVALVGVFLGVFVGNMFIANNSAVDYSSVREADYLPAYAAVYSANNTKSKSSVLPANAYVMAEWQLLQQSGLVESYTIDGGGSVRAKVSGIVQTQGVKKTVEKTAETMTINNITAGLISTAEKTVQHISEQTIDSYVTSTVDKDTLVATYKGTPTKTYELATDDDLAVFRKEYGITPYAFVPYLVSDKTVTKGSYLGEVDGGYKYQITLDNITGVVNYVQYMMHTSGLNRAPTFYELTITFIVDENYRFKQMDIYERYQMYYLGLPAECESQTSYTYSY